MSRGTPAALPDGPYQRPAAVGADWIVRAVGEDGQDNGTYDFIRLPGGPALWAPLAHSFGTRAGSGGSWRRKATLEQAWKGLGSFARWLSAEHPQVLDLTALTRTMWRQYLLALPPSVAASRGAYVRLALLGTDVLTDDTRRAVGRPIANYRPPVQSSLRERDVAILQRRALQTLILAERRIRKGWALLDGYRRGRLDSGSHEERWGAVLNSIFESYDVPRRGAGALSRETIGLIGGTNSIAAFARLYLTAQEAAAGCLGLVLAEGFNPDVVRGLGRSAVTRADAGDGSEPRIFHVDLDKPRRRGERFNSVNLVETGRHSPAHLLGLVIQATEPGRRQLENLGLPHEALFICLPNGIQGRPGVAGPPLTSAAEMEGKAWTRALARWVVSLPEDVPSVTLQQARRFVTTQRHPQGHSDTTNANVYRLNDAAVREAQMPVIATGIQSALDAAEAKVLNTEAAASVEIEPDLAEAIDSGDLDTPTASCTDYDHSPFDDDRFCTASFLSCLGCRNAVVVPRHLPRLIYLYQRLDGLRGNVSDNVWQRDYAAHWMRLSHLLDTKFLPNERAAAERQITDADRAMIDALLRRRYDV